MFDNNERFIDAIKDNQYLLLTSFIHQDYNNYRSGIQGMCYLQIKATELIIIKCKNNIASFEKNESLLMMLKSTIPIMRLILFIDQQIGHNPMIK